MKNMGQLIANQTKYLYVKIITYHVHNGYKEMRIIKNIKQIYLYKF